jgi:phage tail-like protein
MSNGVAGASGAPSAQPGVFVEPYRSYNFKLTIQGVTEGHFTECSGLGITVHAIKYREAGTNGVVHSLPGLVEYADVTLRYGLTSSVELWNWFLTAISGAVERKNVSILMLSSDGTTEVMRWDLLNAWPLAWRGAPLNTLTHEAAIESLTLVFESLQRA